MGRTQKIEIWAESSCSNRLDLFKCNNKLLAMLRMESDCLKFRIIEEESRPWTLKIMYHCKPKRCKKCRLAWKLTSQITATWIIIVRSFPKMDLKTWVLPTIIKPSTPSSKIRLQIQIWIRSGSRTMGPQEMTPLQIAFREELTTTTRAATSHQSTQLSLLCTQETTHMRRVKPLDCERVTAR